MAPEPTGLTMAVFLWRMAWMTPAIPLFVWLFSASGSQSVSLIHRSRTSVCSKPLRFCEDLVVSDGKIGTFHKGISEIAG